MKFQVFGCPSCQRPFQVADTQAGQLVQCPGCAQTVEIPVSAFAKTERPSIEQQVYACPNCTGQFGVTSDMFGQTVGCPHCQTSILVQAPVAPQKTDAAPEVVTGDSASKKNTSKRWKSPLNPDGPKDLFAPGFEKPDERDVDPPPTTPEPKALAAKPVEKSAAEIVSSEVVEDQVSERGPESEPNSKINQPDDQRDCIDHLLPPRFDVLDPTRMRLNTGKDQFQVFLPDGKGGTKQIDQRLVRVEHEGEQVSLVAMTEKEKRRRRLIQNIVAIVIGIIIMAIAFQLLR